VRVGAGRNLMYALGSALFGHISNCVEAVGGIGTRLHTSDLGLLRKLCYGLGRTRARSVE